MTEVIEDVVLKLETADKMKTGQTRYGNLSRKSEGEFDFESAYCGRGERKWRPRKVDNLNRIRVTQHCDRGDWRITVTMDRDKARGLTINGAIDLEAAISDAISFVRSKG